MGRATVATKSGSPAPNRLPKTIAWAREKCSDDDVGIRIHQSIADCLGSLVEIGERRQIDETVASKNDDAIRSMGGEDVLRRANLMDQRFACDKSVLEFDLASVGAAHRPRQPAQRPPERATRAIARRSDRQHCFHPATAA